MIAIVVIAAPNLEYSLVLCEPKAAKEANVLKLGNVHCLNSVSLQWNKLWDTQRSGIACCTEGQFHFGGLHSLDQASEDAARI